jgi:replicative DNA helicase
MSNFNQLDLVILKNLITHKKHALDFAAEQDAKLFSPETWNCANVIITYLRTYKELPTLRVLTEKIKNEKLVNSITNIWNALDNVSINDKEYQHDLERIKKRFAEQQIAQVKEVLSHNADVEKSVAEMQKTLRVIEDLKGHKAYEDKNIKDYLPSFVERFNAKKNNPALDRGLMTGYNFLDFATNGLKPADFLLVAGETGFGKSLLLNNIAIQVWLQKNDITKRSGFSEGKDIIYFSLEMPYEDCFNRLLSRLSGVPTRSIENAKLSKEEFDKVKSALDFIAAYPYQFKIVDIVDASANDLERILIDGGEAFDAIFLDYLGLSKTNDKSDEADWQRQSVAAYEYRQLARKYKVPVFSAVQLNRKKDGTPEVGLHRLARSSGISTHCTTILQIESRQRETSYNDFSVWLIKNRKGPLIHGLLMKNLACATLLNKPNDDSYDDGYNDSIFTDHDDISGEMKDLVL